jgi:cytochrome c oxidase subunit I
MNGMPRRYPIYAPEFQIFNILSTAGAFVQGIGYILPAFYLTASLFTGRNAGANPWRATGLEWQVASPPPAHNFEGVPVVEFGPYEYSLPNPKFAYRYGSIPFKSDTRHGHGSEGHNGHAANGTTAKEGVHA